MKFMRNALLIAFFILATLAASLWAVTYWVKPGTFNAIAKKQLTSLTQQDSSIEGTVKWRLFPRPGLHITNVRIGNTKKTDAVYSLFVDNLLFNVRMLPLLKGQLVFNQLALDGFTLRVNLEGKPSENAPPKSKQNQTTPTHNKLVSHIALKSLLLTNGQIILTHHETEHATLSHVRLEASFPKTRYDHAPLQIKANLTNDSLTSPVRAALYYKGLIRLAPPSAKGPNTLLDNLEVDGQLELQDLLFRNYDFSKITTHLVLAKKLLKLNPLTVALYNGESIGQLSYQINTKQLEFNQTGTALNAEPVFHSLLGDKPPKLKGSLDFSLHILTNLAQPFNMETSNINGSVTLKDGTLAYVNLKAITHEATKTLHHLAKQPLDNLNILHEALGHLKPWNINDYSGNTPFKLINLAFQSNENHLLTYNLLLETKKLHLKGQGDFNIETTDVHGKFTANLSTYDPTILALQQVFTHGFPLIVRGKIDDLSIHIDHTSIKHLFAHGLPAHISKPLKFIQQQLQHTSPDTPTSNTPHTTDETIIE